MDADGGAPAEAAPPQVDVVGELPSFDSAGPREHDDALRASISSPANLPPPFEARDKSLGTARVLAMLLARGRRPVLLDAAEALELSDADAVVRLLSDATEPPLASLALPLPAELTVVIDAGTRIKAALDPANFLQLHFSLQCALVDGLHAVLNAGGQTKSLFHVVRFRCYGSRKEADGGLVRRLLGLTAAADGSLALMTRLVKLIGCVCTAGVTAKDLKALLRALRKPTRMATPIIRALIEMASPEEKMVKAAPLAFFNFGGPGAGLFLPPTAWPFAKGAVIATWFRAESFPRDRRKRGKLQPHIVRFLDDTEQRGIDVYFDGPELRVRIAAGEAETILPMDAPPQAFFPRVWYSLVITHTRPKMGLFGKECLSITIDGATYWEGTVHLPAKYDAVFTKCGIGENFDGQMAPMFVFREPVSSVTMNALSQYVAKTASTFGKHAPRALAYQGTEAPPDLEPAVIGQSRFFCQRVFAVYHPSRCIERVCLEVHSGLHAYMGRATQSWALSGARDVISSIGGVPAIFPLLSAFMTQQRAALDGWGVPMDTAAEAEGESAPGQGPIALVLALLARFIRGHSTNQTEMLKLGGAELLEHALFHCPGELLRSEGEGCVCALLELCASAQGMPALEEEFNRRLLFNLKLWSHGSLTLQTNLLPVLVGCVQGDPARYKKILGVAPLLDMTRFCYPTATGETAAKTARAQAGEEKGRDPGPDSEPEADKLRDAAAAQLTLQRALLTASGEDPGILALGRIREEDVRRAFFSRSSCSLAAADDAAHNLRGSERQHLRRAVLSMLRFSLAEGGSASDAATLLQFIASVDVPMMRAEAMQILLTLLSQPQPPPDLFSALYDTVQRSSAWNRHVNAARPRMSCGLEALIMELCVNSDDELLRVLGIRFLTVLRARSRIRSGAHGGRSVDTARVPASPGGNPMQSITDFFVGGGAKRDELGVYPRLLQLLNEHGATATDATYAALLEMLLTVEEDEHEVTAAENGGTTGNGSRGAGPISPRATSWSDGVRQPRWTELRRPERQVHAVAETLAQVVASQLEARNTMRKGAHSQFDSALLLLPSQLALSGVPMGEGCRVRDPLCGAMLFKLLPVLPAAARGACLTDLLLLANTAPENCAAILRGGKAWQLDLVDLVAPFIAGVDDVDDEEEEASQSSQASSPTGSPSHVGIRDMDGWYTTAVDLHVQLLCHSLEHDAQGDQDAEVLFCAASYARHGAIAVTHVLARLAQRLAETVKRKDAKENTNSVLFRNVMHLAYCAGPQLLDPSGALAAAVPRLKLLVPAAEQIAERQRQQRERAAAQGNGPRCGYECNPDAHAVCMMSTSLCPRCGHALELHAEPVDQYGDIRTRFAEDADAAAAEDPVGYGFDDDPARAGRGWIRPVRPVPGRFTSPKRARALAQMQLLGLLDALVWPEKAPDRFPPNHVVSPESSSDGGAALLARAGFTARALHQGPILILMLRLNLDLLAQLHPATPHAARAAKRLRLCAEALQFAITNRLDLEPGKPPAPSRRGASPRDTPGIQDRAHIDTEALASEASRIDLASAVATGEDDVEAALPVPSSDQGRLAEGGQRKVARSARLFRLTQRDIPEADAKHPATPIRAQSVSRGARPPVTPVVADYSRNQVPHAREWALMMVVHVQRGLSRLVGYLRGRGDGDAASQPDEDTSLAAYILELLGALNVVSLTLPDAILHPMLRVKSDGGVTCASLIRLLNGFRIYVGDRSAAKVRAVLAELRQLLESACGNADAVGKARFGFLNSEAHSGPILANLDHLYALSVLLCLSYSEDRQTERTRDLLDRRWAAYEDSDHFWLATSQKAEVHAFGRELAQELRLRDAKRLSAESVEGEIRSLATSDRWQHLMRVLTAQWSPWAKDQARTSWKLSRHQDHLRRRMLLVENPDYKGHEGAAYHEADGALPRFGPADPDKLPQVPAGALPRDAAAEQHQIHAEDDFEDEGAHGGHLSPSERLSRAESNASMGDRGSAVSPTPTNLLEAWAIDAAPNERKIDTYPVTKVDPEPEPGSPGTVTLTTQSLYFQPADGAATKRMQRWRLARLTEVHGRRFLLRPCALELFFADGHEVFFSFASQRSRMRFYRTLRRQAPACPLLRSPRSLQPRRALEHGRWTERWRNREISNFEYLMRLNLIAGRSYNDLTQYPVFPWILADYASEELDLSDPKTFRDLSKPMGALNPERLEAFVDRYKSLQSDPYMPAFMYGSHYSSAGVVLHYLLRQEPFSTLAVDLHDGRFDCPDRLFFNLKESYRSCTTSMTDVKELIPEFFYLPEIFVNSNRFVLGSLQDGDAVDGVLMPPWAKGDPWECVRLHREALESEAVTKQLHLWIDLVFGHKQRGPAAEAAHNVFFYLTYEGGVDIDDIDDLIERKATEQQIYHFGQTPSQLLTEPHPPRLPQKECILTLGAGPLPPPNPSTPDPELSQLRCYAFQGGRSSFCHHGPLLAVVHVHDRLLTVHADLSVRSNRWSKEPDGGGKPFTLRDVLPVRLNGAHLSVSPFASRSAAETSTSNVFSQMLGSEHYTAAMARGGGGIGAAIAAAEAAARASRAAEEAMEVDDYTGRPSEEEIQADANAKALAMAAVAAQAKAGDVRSPNNGRKGHLRRRTSVSYVPEAQDVLSGDARNTDSGVLGGVVERGVGPWCFGVGLGASSGAHAAELKLVSTGYWDDAVKCHDPETGKEAHSSSGGHRGAVNCLQIGEDGYTLATGGQDATCRLWIVAHADLANATMDDSAYHTSLSDGWSPSATAPGVSRDDLVCVHVLWGHDNPVTCLALSTKLDVVVSGGGGGGEGIIVIHQVRRGKFVRRFRVFDDRRPTFGDRGSERGEAESPLAMGGAGALAGRREDKGSLALLALSATTAEFSAHTQDEGPEQRSFLRRYSLNGRLLAKMDMGTERLDALIYGHDGRMLYSGGEAGTIALRAAHSLELLHTIEDGASHRAVRCLSFSMDFQYLFAGYEDGSLFIVTDPRARLSMLEHALDNIHILG